MNRRHSALSEEVGVQSVLSSSSANGESMSSEEHVLRRVIKELDRFGILLEVDSRLPNVASLVAGERITGSWWTHKRSRLICRILNRFLASGDSLTVRLVSGKVTFVHRRLWADLLGVCTSGEDWQSKGLSNEALSLLKTVEEQSEVRTDLTRWRKKESIGDAARELERGLLVHSEEIHTEKGSHAKILRSWREWSSMTGFHESTEAGEAKRKFEKLVEILNEEFGARGRLPWIGS